MMFLIEKEHSIYHIIGTAPAKLAEQSILKASWLDTTLGPMIAIASDTALYLLEFVDRRGLEREIKRLRNKINHYSRKNRPDYFDRKGISVIF